MVRRFRGESVHKVDGKGRVSIPAPFRRVLEEGDPDWVPGGHPTLVLVYGLVHLRPCLEGYSLKGIEDLDDQIAALPRFSRERERLERLINSQSVYVQLDDTGRIVLTARLREMIGVAGEAMFAGMGEKFQIWEPGAYRADMARIEAALAGDDGADPFAALDRPRAGG